MQPAVLFTGRYLFEYAQLDSFIRTFFVAGINAAGVRPESIMECKGQENGDSIFCGTIMCPHIVKIENGLWCFPNPLEELNAGCNVLKI